MNNDETPFEIGTIVTLKSNNLFKEEFLGLPISIAANQDYAQPLMVITEVTIKKNTDFCNETGSVKPDYKGLFTYKCMYFSSRNFKFEENNFQSNEIIAFEILKRKRHIIKLNSVLKYGNLVSFKTNEFEILKVKSALNIDSVEANTNRTHLVSYTTPAFTFCGYIKVEKKDPEFDKENPNKRIKHYPIKMAKIKAFNYHADKFSEFIVPIESLNLTPIFNENILKELTIILRNTEKKSLMILQTTNGKEFASISNIYTHSGLYILNYIDLILNKNKATLINDIRQIEKIDVSEHLPTVAPIGNKSIPYKSISNYIKQEDTLSDNSYLIEGKQLYITYRGLNGRISNRFILVETIFDRTRTPKKEQKDNDEARNKTFILSAYCYHKKDTRHFNSERIIRICEVSEEISSLLLNAKD